MEKEEKTKAEKMFDDIVTNPSIKEVSVRHFMNGEFRSAILDAFIQLEQMIKEKTNFPKDNQGREMFGCSLMRKVFNVKSPLLKWSKLEHQTEIDELEGYQQIMAGVVQGIRDPKAHLIFEQKPLRALQLITLAALLADLVDVAEYVKPQKQHPSESI